MRKNPNRITKRLVSLYAEPRQEKALRALSKRTARPMQFYLRRGLDLVLAEYKAK